MNVKSKVYAFFFLAPALLVVTPAWSGDESRPFKLTGMFSDMSYNSEGGDVLGQEIFIVYSKDGYFAILQNSEGEPGKPVVVPVTLKGAAVTFRVPATLDPRGEFHGVISQDELVGSFSGNGQTIHLKRKNSYWQ